MKLPPHTARATSRSVASALVLGCAAVAPSGCATLATNEEFALYRAYRYESSAERRTALGSEYLERYPNGRFRAEAMGDVGRREEEFWEQRRSTFEGLQAYLTSYPRGPHAVEARSRLSVYEEERRRQQVAQAAADEAERQRLAEERRASNERMRLFARNTMLAWLRTFGSVDGWGEPIGVLAQRNPDFNTAFGAEPAPVCRAGRCRKAFQIDFFVPQPGRSAIPRRLNMSVDLLLRDRRVVQAALLLHRRGVSQWYECETLALCDPADADARQQSIQWAMNQLRAVVARAFPEARETPPELTGPEPEMEGADEDSAEVATAANQPAPPIPPQPLGLQWSYVVGCGSLGGARITTPEGATPSGWEDASSAPTAVRSCLRIDAYSAPDIEGVRTDEGLRVSWIPASALPAPGRRPRPGPARPPARPAGATARPAAAPAHP